MDVWGARWCTIIALMILQPERETRSKVWCCDTSDCVLANTKIVLHHTHMHLSLLILPAFSIASMILAGYSSGTLLTYIAFWCKRLCIAGVWPLPTSSHTGSTLLWFHSDWASTSHQCKRWVPLTDGNLLIINCWQFLITSWHRRPLQKYHGQCSSNVCANLAIIL